MKKIKYLFSVCFVAVFVFCMGVGVKAEETESDTSVFEYRENEDGTIDIYEYNGTDETVTFPSEIDGKKVKCIGSSAYSVSDTLKYVTVSEGITGLRASFESCENLETVSLPSTLKTIGKSAFSRCHKLREINLPEGLISIGDRAFFECSELNNINLPDGLESIGNSAFGNCASIEKLVIPDSVTYIGDYAFGLNYEDRIPIYGNPDAYIKTYCDTIDKKIKFSCINHANVIKDPAIAPNCTEYGRTEGSHCTICGTYIVRPQRIEPNGQHAWDDGIIQRRPTARRNGRKMYTCTVCHGHRIETIVAPKKGDSIADSNASYKVINLSTKGSTVEFSAAQKSEVNITIPNTVKIDGITYKVTSIAKNAFKNNKNLKKITINGSITKINANAFSGCTNLKTIKIKSKNLKSVGKNAFKGINPKAKIKVPSSCLEKYKKLLAKKGQKSSVKITR